MLPDQEGHAKNMELFVVYWNELLPRSAGVSRWGPAKKNYLLPSSSTPKPDAKECAFIGDRPCISIQDEVFVAWCLEDKLDRWKFNHELSQLSPAQCQEREDKLTEKEKSEDEKRQETRYTDSKSGQKKYGGVTNEGIKRFVQIFKMVKANREKNAEYLKQVEEIALEKVREINGCDKIDEKKKARKRKADDAEPAGYQPESDDEGCF